MALHTMKFGGTSVGSPEAIEQVISIIQREITAGSQVVSVVSAMSGVTDALLKSVKAATDGDRWTYQQINQDLRHRHEDAIHRLVEPPPTRESTLQEITRLLDEHIQLCEAINTLGEATPRIIDAIVSFGERLSSRVISAALDARGTKSIALESGDFIITDNNYQDAEPLWGPTEQRIVEKLRPIVANGITPIITGFIGSTPDGSITTLGRGGSDFSAAILAAYLDSDELTIWTDVDGVMTTDPRIDKRAKVLPYVSYTEVGELAFYGAKVLHPKTVQPIVTRNIPMRVRNTFNPDHPGTQIGAETVPTETIIKAVTSIRSISMLTVSGKGMLGVPGIAGRTFLATARAGANILMISQSSSEQSFCYTVRDENAPFVKAAVESELGAEIAHQDVDGIDIMSDVVIVTVVGGGMRGTPGVAGRVFTTLGNKNINVISIAQGGSECSISFVLEEKDLEIAVHSLHDLALASVVEETVY
ncbi:aspartate kinase [Phototrophicus methaneseepsis]|uniref:Aspartokinase n=1 Tax=Phototrophicus methaneseepsis TaxID=2710758 RepID=A0A7S8IGS6_9CHLR|nr:aspartate kinase [Phototrophicus methaneseepsis]QPC84989.1 aspartate kinase [Phototrophicus methaneseepsis]